jgi:hypothetical protein
LAVEKFLAREAEHVARVLGGHFEIAEDIREIIAAEVRTLLPNARGSVARSIR